MGVINPGYCTLNDKANHKPLHFPLQQQQTDFNISTATMATVAQQYYEEAAQNEQMGEEDEGVSKIILCVHHDDEIPWQCIRGRSR